MELYVEIKKNLPGFVLDVKFEGSKERIALLGASGSGKTMTLRCVAGLVKPDEGKIIFNGKTFFDSKKGINVKPKHRKVGFLFQNYALFPHLTVKDNIAFGIKGLSDRERNLKVSNLLERFDLTGLENRYPHLISGGQQQRTALARAIATDPDIILLDEPFSALDEHLRSHMAKEMLEILKGFGGTTLFVTHNIEEAYRICEKIAVLCSGKLHVFGNKKDVFENPQTSEAARITGCKNIVEAVRVDDGYIEIPSWNIRLKTDSKIKAEKGYYGVRANHIRLSNGNNSDNVFKAKIVGNIETQFRQTVYLKFAEAPDGNSDYHVQWEVSKDIWDQINKEAGFINIRLPQDKMYFEK
jgi:ABC-type sulfate/molybdate transport systems ATPase subunit